MSPVKLQRLSYKLRKLPFIPKLITYIIRLIFSAYLPYQLDLNKNFTLAYGGLGVVIHSRVKFGYDCHISQHVTIGGTSKIFDVPKLGNHVYVGSGAKIIGPINIGDNVVIGANAVISKDIPSGSLVVGVPGKIIKSGIKKSDYI